MYLVYEIRSATQAYTDCSTPSNRDSTRIVLLTPNSRIDEGSREYLAGSITECKPDNEFARDAKEALGT